MRCCRPSGAGRLTPLDCLDALEARIAAVDGAVNALPILCFERARDQARRLMQRPLGERGRLAGLPVPIKDLTDVEGVRTTYGSPIFADFVPEASDILVQTIEAEGGVIYAKSNTPEFGAGGNTFNEVFGATLNPWNTGFPPPDHQVGPRSRSRPARLGWRRDPTSAAACAIRPAFAGWSACGQARAASPAIRARRSTGSWA